MSALAKYGSSEFVARLTIRYPNEFIFQPSEKTFACGSLLNWKKPSEIETLLGVDLESPMAFAVGFLILAVTTLVLTKGNTLISGLSLCLGAVIVGYFFEGGFLVCLVAGGLGVLLMIGSILFHSRIERARDPRTGATLTRYTGSGVIAAEPDQFALSDLQNQVEQLQRQLNHLALPEGRRER